MAIDIGPHQAPLEQYPHIIENLHDVWHSLDFYDYIKSLLLPDRPGRQGFPLDVLMELEWLLDIHRTVLPPWGADTWDTHTL
jgi:hypothetical protein